MGLNKETVIKTPLDTDNKFDDIKTENSDD